MSRQTFFGGATAGAGAAMRLDPAALPLRFETHDPGADGGSRMIDLFDRHVVIRRFVAGSKMKLTMPVAAYHGVAVRVGPGAAPDSDSVEVILVHADSALSVPLYVADSADDVVAEWQAWGKRLGQPLLMVRPDGTLATAIDRMGGVVVGAPLPRRRRRSAVRGRRPQALMRRRVGGPLAACPVHREREIIART